MILDVHNLYLYLCILYIIINYLIYIYLLYWTNVFRQSNNNKTFIIFNKDEYHTQVSIHIRHSKESWTVDIPNIPYSHSICHSQNEQWPPQMTMMDLKIHALKKNCALSNIFFFRFHFQPPWISDTIALSMTDRLKNHPQRPSSMFPSFSLFG